MKIAFVSFDFGEYCVRVATALAQNAEVQLLLPHYEALPYHYMLGRDVRLWTFEKPRLRQPLRQLKMLWGLLRQIIQFEPDVVHLQAGHLWFNLALPLLRRYPLVLTVHDPFRHPGDRGAMNTPQWISDFGCYRATKIIVHAEALKEILLGRLSLPPSKVHVIPTVLLGDDKDQRDVSEEDACILFFGRIWPYKGLEYLIRAEPLITAEVPNAKIVIAGTGESLDRYREMMVHPGSFIVHNNYVPDQKRAELFRQASVVTLPYTEASQSGVIPIAYRFGKPVVATNVGGLPELIEDGETGYLVPPRNESALAAAIVRLLKDKTLRRKLGANARQLVNTRCSPETIAAQTCSVYEAARTLNLNGTPEAQFGTEMR